MTDNAHELDPSKRKHIIVSATKRPAILVKTGSAPPNITYDAPRKLPPLSDEELKALPMDPAGFIQYFRYVFDIDPNAPVTTTHLQLANIHFKAPLAYVFEGVSGKTGTLKVALENNPSHETRPGLQVWSAMRGIHFMPENDPSAPPHKLYYFKDETHTSHNPQTLTESGYKLPEIPLRDLDAELKNTPPYERSINCGPLAVLAGIRSFRALPKVSSL